MCGIGSRQVQAAVVAVAVAAAAHAAYVTADFGVGFENAEVVVLGPREFARTGKVVMVGWLVLVVLWLDFDEVVPVAAAVEGAVSWNTRELENGLERVVG